MTGAMRMDLGDGVAGRLEVSNGDRVVAWIPRAAPTGSTLEGTVLGVRVSVKVRGCRRDGDEFRVEGRLVGLTRAQRKRLTDGEVS